MYTNRGAPHDGLKVPITSIEDAIKSVIGYLPIYQVIIEHESGKDRLTFVINSEPSKELENKFMEAIISSTQELEETFHLEKKIEVNIVLSKDMDNFIKTERGKIPKIIDRRNKK